MPSVVLGTQLSFIEALPENDRVTLDEAWRWIERHFPSEKSDDLKGLRERAYARVSILQALGLDTQAMVACLLYSARDSIQPDQTNVSSQFGESTATLLKGVSAMDVMSAYSRNLQHRESVSVSSENLRRMLIAMIDDVRVVLIKLTCQLEELRSIKAESDRVRKTIARETIDVFAPLANRLGVWQLKWELEDLAFRYLEPEVYQTIARKLAEKRVDRESYLDNFVASVSTEMQTAGVVAEVGGRPKHIYSIFKKMQRKQTEFDQILDVRAVRILVDEISDCYAALGVVHTRWMHVAGEFDDYIATPKENGYQSIHTAVVGPGGKVVEVQIRTHNMHQENELGIAAHWRYKEDAKHNAAVDNKVLWLRLLLDWKDEVDDSVEFLDQFRTDLFEERVYVFTPKGNVVDLPNASTPLDFAYAIHTEVGHRCRGAKVNGKMVPLNYRLETGQQVEILTVKQGRPSRDWLNPNLGFLSTPRARGRVQRWFKHQDFDLNVSAGRSSLERELKRLGASGTAYESLADELDYPSVEDFLAAIGSGDLKLSQAVGTLRRTLLTATEPKPRPRQRSRLKQDAAGAFDIEGVGNLLTSLAACCNPVPGDLIVGYITQGRGVTIHRADCHNILRLESGRAERLLEVQWTVREGSRYPVDIRVRGINRKDLLHDITSIASDEKVNVLAVNLKTEPAHQSVSVDLTIEISDLNQLSRILARIGQVVNVTDVRRVSQ